MQKLGKNHGGYHGETINIRDVLEAILTVAHCHGWTTELFLERSGFKWFALHRTAHRFADSSQIKRVYISAGIHGDEPAGPLAVLSLLQKNQWPQNAEVTIVPCLNPMGFVCNKRENDQGLDLNRDYRRLQSSEVRAHISWLTTKPMFDVHFCLHEDWESHGFYLYEQNPRSLPSLSKRIIEAVKIICPIDLSEMIEGRSATNGVIQPNINRAQLPDWPEAIYLISNKTLIGYTLEAPSDFPLVTRVGALASGVSSAI